MCASVYLLLHHDIVRRFLSFILLFIVCFIYLFVYLLIFSFIYLFIYLFIYFIHSSIHTSIVSCFLLPFFYHFFICRGFITLITGSKFYEGPPFSGAVVLPLDISQEIESHIKLSTQSIPETQTRTETKSQTKSKTTTALSQTQIEAEAEAASITESSNTDSGSNSRLLSNIVCAVPSGLSDYITPYDVPTDMPYLRQFLLQDDSRVSSSSGSSSQWCNIGLIMRWTLGLNSMENYTKIPIEKIKKITENWVTGVKESVSGCPFLSLLEVGEGLMEGNMVGDINTIISFGVNIIENDKYRELNFDEMKIFHKLMTLSVPVPASVAVSESVSEVRSRIEEVLATKIMLGQPVKLAEPVMQTHTVSGTESVAGTGSVSGLGSGSGAGTVRTVRAVGTVVRIALGATMVIEAVRESESNIEKMRLEDAVVVEKIHLLAKYWEEINSPPPPLTLTPTTTLTPPLSTTPTTTTTDTATPTTTTTAVPAVIKVEDVRLSVSGQGLESGSKVQVDSNGMSGIKGC